MSMRAWPGAVGTPAADAEVLGDGVHLHPQRALSPLRPRKRPHARVRMIATLHNRVEHPSTRELKSTNLTPGCSRRRPSTCATFARRRPGTSDVHARAVRCSAVVVRMPPAGVRRRDVKMRVHPQRAHEPRSGPDDVHARVVGKLAAGVRAVQGKYEAHAAHDSRPGLGDVHARVGGMRCADTCCERGCGARRNEGTSAT
ncbi:hypothetical protein B0H11DRAFT_2251760 [Mycena galericulata]|nr:hypothetical protein B0H11DRAFT_2251760 [Mycena galericulata]